MKDLILCLIVLVIAFILRFCTYNISKKKKNGNNLMIEMQYLINRFKLNKNKVNTVTIACVMSFMDALIISISLFLSIRLSDNTIVEILIAFVLVMGLIILFNEFIGRILKKKGYDKR